MKIAHITDVHWMTRPPLARLWGKRFLGTANLYLRGRKDHFQRSVQDQLVEALLELDPDVLLFTGDLTAQALPEEFEVARAALEPVLATIPTFVIPGNHDVYTHGALRDARIQRWFADWMHLDDDGLGRFSMPGLTVVGLDPNRPTVLSASGRVPDQQLAALAAALAAAPADDALVLAVHYPLIARDGSIYDGSAHGLVNARELIDVLRGASRRPEWIVHGHVHHGYTSSLDLGDLQVPIHNPGASGYAWLPDHDRAACFNLYTTEGPQLGAVERYRFGPDGFSREPGGAYATGR